MRVPGAGTPPHITTANRHPARSAPVCSTCGGAAHAGAMFRRESHQRRPTRICAHEIGAAILDERRPHGESLGGPAADLRPDILTLRAVQLPLAGKAGLSVVRPRDRVRRRVSCWRAVRTLPRPAAGGEIRQHHPPERSARVVPRAQALAGRLDGGAPGRDHGPGTGEWPDCRCRRSAPSHEQTVLDDLLTPADLMAGILTCAHGFGGRSIVAVSAAAVALGTVAGTPQTSAPWPDEWRGGRWRTAAASTISVAAASASTAP
jgi:hypothetical protein